MLQGTPSRATELTSAVRCPLLQVLHELPTPLPHPQDPHL